MAKDNFDFVAAVYLLRADGSALLQHRDDLPGLRHANMWVPPGGHAEPGETPIECARRELLEETCYLCADLHFLTVYDYPAEEGWPPFPLHFFWSVDDGRQNVTCREGQALEFVSRKQADKLLMPPYILPLWDEALAAFAGCHGKLDQTMRRNSQIAPLAPMKGLQTPLDVYEPAAPAKVFPLGGAAGSWQTPKRETL